MRALRTGLDPAEATDPPCGRAVYGRNVVAGHLVMSYAREMLDAAPGGGKLGPAKVAAAIEACADGVQACSACADACLAEDDLAALRTCIGLDQNCAEVCSATARVLSRPAHFDNLLVHRLLQACVRSCAQCADECGRHAAHHRHCAICAKACRACEQACTELLDAEAFEALQKLVGG